MARFGVPCGTKHQAVRNFFSPIEDEPGEDIGPSEEELEIEEDRQRKEAGRDIIFQRKILKSRFSSRRGRKAVQVFALTFEDNNTDRFAELLEEVRKYNNDNFLFFGEEDYGYDDQQGTTTPPFIFPVIEVGVE